MSEINKKYLIGAIVLVLAIGAAIVLKNPQGGNTPAVSPTPDTRTKEQIYQDYLLEGQKYRTLAFQGDASAFDKAIDVYKKAAEFTEDKVWVPYMNLGTTYQAMKNYTAAEEAYNKALEIGPGEGLLYQKKADLYRYDLKKSEDEVIAVYKAALDRLGNPDNVIIDYAAYLKEIGRYEESLKYYKILVEKYPNSQTYKDEIADLKAKVK